MSHCDRSMVAEPVVSQQVGMAVKVELEPTWLVRSRTCRFAHHTECATPY